MPLPLSQIHQTMQTAADPHYPNNSRWDGVMTMIFRLRDIQDPQHIYKEHRLIVMPTQYSKDTEGRSAMYYTQEGVTIDTPLDNGIGLTYFTISGSTLYRGITLPPETAAGLFNLPLQQGSATSQIDGAAAIKDFEDTIRQYFFPADSVTTATLHTSDLALEFLNLHTPGSASDPIGLLGYRIHPHRNLVSIRQDARQPFIWHYVFSFAGVELLKDAIVPDGFLTNFTDVENLQLSTIANLNNVLRDTTNQFNTLAHAFDLLVIQNVTGPLSTFLINVALLSKATQNFVGGLANKIQFPLYARNQIIENVINAPSHSVSTLAQSAIALGNMLTQASLGRSISGLGAGTSLISGINDVLLMSLNGEPIRRLTLGNQPNGPSIASAIQTGIRGSLPTSVANAAAYRGFTATYDGTSYALTSGTVHNQAASVRVGIDDQALATQNAASVLKLGTANGGQEQPGSSAGLKALHLLRGVIQAAQTLQSFPEYFADSLQTQVVSLSDAHSAPLPNLPTAGPQALRAIRLRTEDTVLSVATRAQLAWQTLATTNNMRYPYIEAAVTLLTGRATSATAFSLTQAGSRWEPDVYQGQRLDILAGTAQGASSIILSNTLDTLLLDEAWDTIPDATSDFAIRGVDTAYVHTGRVSQAASRTLTETTLAMVPGSQRGLQIRIIVGPGAGQHRRVLANTRDTYTLDKDWDAIPGAGATYVVLDGGGPHTRFTKQAGNSLAIPRPTITTPPRGVRTGVQDTGTLTGNVYDEALALFGRDLTLLQGDLLWDTQRQDLARIQGTENLKQAVLMKLNAGLGEFEFHPQLGSYLRESLGQWATLIGQQELIHSVERTVRLDPRVARLIGLQLETSGGSVALSFHAEAVNGAATARIVVR